MDLRKKKNSQAGSVQVHLAAAHNRAKAVPFTLSSNDIMGLLIESIQLAKLATTEKRDLEVIRNDYKLKSEYLEKQHQEVIALIENEYKERGAIIAAINSRAEQLISAGQYEAGHAIMNRMIDIISNDSPLRRAMEFRNRRLLT